jgi:hypothetical protein
VRMVAIRLSAEDDKEVVRAEAVPC